jgi:hypothetical protein
MRVLIVEDEPYLADAIRDGLRLAAITVAQQQQRRQRDDRDVAQLFICSYTPDDVEPTHAR